MKDLININNELSSLLQIFVEEIAEKDSFVYADKLNHASLNDACILSRGKFIRFPHNDMVAFGYTHNTDLK